MQSHGGQVRRNADFRQGCDDLVDSATPARFTHRSLLRAAVFGQRGSAYHNLWDPRQTSAQTAVSGQVLDVSPHLIVLQTAQTPQSAQTTQTPQTPQGELRLALSPTTTAWRGSMIAPAALRHGDHVIVRRHQARNVAERMWAQIGRVTGTIMETQGSELLVDEGPAKGRKIVLIDKGSQRQIQVRFPRLEPGYLIDVIGLRQQGYLRALTHATSQPGYRADHPPSPALINGHIPLPVTGTAVWHEPGEEPTGLLGVAYPALDPETDCRPSPATHEPYVVDPHAAVGCVRLPYLSVGSAVRIRNECTDRAAVLPVTSCGATARLFCDRCVECGTSPRGRIADLTVTAFVELGGDLEKGCFNATLTMAG
jgi:hypothetical protein